MVRTDVNVYWLRPDELTIYRGHSVLITDSRGAIGSGIEGLYFHRTRFLSRCLLRVDGTEPNFVSANPVEPHSMISYHLAESPAKAAAGPAGTSKGGGEIAHKAIEIQLNRFVGGQGRFAPAAPGRGVGAGCARLQTSDRLVQSAWDRAVADHRGK